MSISASRVTRFGIGGGIWSPAGSFAGKDPGPLAAGGLYNAAEWFTSGGNVTISLYDPLLTGASAISVTSNVCIEVGATGLYVWDASKLSVFPRSHKEYVWTMTDGSTTEGGVLRIPYAASRSRTNAVLYR
jgi:hypothetical protein|tara:strand:+ start:739 stop:1131 length:393 start_codon:yes stop_codon:yes gene_type:complete